MPANPWLNSLWVFLGAGIGANARYWIGHWAVLKLEVSAFGTFGINVLGSLLMGMFLAYSHKNGHSPGGSAFVATGLLGGFTTFSAFSAEAIHLYQNRSVELALLYVGLSVIVSIAGCWAGLALMRAILGA